MKHACEDSCLRTHLQGSVSKTVEASDDTSACDLKSVVLQSVHMKHFGCDWISMMCDVSNGDKQLTHNSTCHSVLVKFCVTDSHRTASCYVH
jgi:hypothetical protein